MLQVAKRKRAPRCNRLDDPEIKQDIMRLYVFNQKTVEEVRQEINGQYNLSATMTQYRDRLLKWGFRKRLNHEEYQKVYRQMQAREGSGKASEVLLGGIVTVDDTKIQRWASRNITFTDRIMMKQEIAGAMTGPSSDIMSLVQVHTPGANDILTTWPEFKKSIPVSVLQSLPIWQASKSLDCFLRLNTYTFPHGNGDSRITAYQSHPHFPLLRGLIYQISNDLIYVKRDILKLLHQVDRYNIREGLKKLLSNDSTTILAVCEVLIPWVYLRGDYEMLQSIRKSHPGIVIRLYDIILEFYERHLHDLWNVSDSERDIVPSEEEFSRRAMGDLYKLGEAPASALEGFILLNICKLAKQGLFVFFELWNPNEFSPASLEGGRRSFRRFLEAQHRFHVPSDSPLQTDDLGELQSLIDVGFTSRMSTLLLMAILRNEMGKTLIFLKQLKPELHSAIEQAQYPKHTWELFSFPYFYRIILDAGVELSYVGHEHKPPAPASESSINWEDVSNIKAADKFLHSIPYINPEISDYVIQTLRWRYPLRPEEGFLLVVDSNNITAPPEDRLYNFNIPMKHNIRALTKFLGLGLDLNGSNLWKKTVWNWLLEPRPAHKKLYANQLMLPVLRLIVEAGADIDHDIEARDLTMLLRIDCNIFEGRQLLKPIEVALLMPESSIFLFLIRRMAETSVLLFETSLDRGVILPEFIQAVHNRDLGLIRELWKDRIVRTFREKLEFLLARGEFEAAQHLTELECASNGLSSLDEAMPVIIRRLGDPDDRDLWPERIGPGYQSFLQILVQKLPDWGPESGSDDRDDTSIYIEAYGFFMQQAISINDAAMLDILLDAAKPNVLQSIMKLHRLVVHAARKNCLWGVKRLVQRGFDVNETDLVRHKALRAESAIGITTQRGSLELAAYLLSEDASIYVPYSFWPSVVSFAVIFGRIDMLALFLEVDPGCLPLALEAAQETLPRHQYIADFVRNWKPTAAAQTAPGTDTGRVELTGDIE